MLSKLPIDLSRVSGKRLDLEILRMGIIAELDAINLYEQMAESTSDEFLRRMLLDIAREEKTHFGEFLAYLLRLDEEQEGELEKGREEVEEMGGGR